MIRDWIGLKLIKLGLKILTPEVQLLLDFATGIGEAERHRLEAAEEFDNAFENWKKSVKG